jgi:cytochrome oxidase assembly protein ShyY1
MIYRSVMAHIYFYYSAMVFVNRGWVPKALAEWARPEGSVTLEAVVSEPEKVRLGIHSIEAYAMGSMIP